MGKAEICTLNMNCFRGLHTFILLPKTHIGDLVTGVIFQSNILSHKCYGTTVRIAQFHRENKMPRQASKSSN